ncbi:MAG: hypothetical protein LC745_04430 [Planctomycetia bacterium]|nr:hypothetical protein [Planctomycetia bacterium]
MRPRRLRSLPWSALALALSLSAGCEEPRHAAGGKPAPAPQAAKKQEDTFIVGKRTQDIRDADAELKKGQQEGSTKITAKDPISLAGNAYVTSIGRTSILQIEHAMNLYKAANDRYPKDYDEFMAEIIKANNIALPQLPYYQTYGYKADEHRLIILEDLAKKNQVPR